MTDLAAIVARDAAGGLNAIDLSPTLDPAHLDWQPLIHDYWDTVRDRRALLVLLRDAHTTMWEAHEHSGIDCDPDHCRTAAMLERLQGLLPTADDVRGILA